MSLKRVVESSYFLDHKYALLGWHLLGRKISVRQCVAAAQENIKMALKNTLGVTRRRQRPYILNDGMEARIKSLVCSRKLKQKRYISLPVLT